MSRVHLQSISPNNLHGYSANRLQLQDLDEKLSVIFAPNASGKSTLAKAIRLLFDPVKGEVGSSSIVGELSINGVSSLKNSSKVSLIRQEGFPSAGDSYHLDIVSLLSGFKSTEQAFLQELIGDGIKIQVQTEKTKPQFSKLKVEAKSKIEALNELEILGKELLKKEDELPALDKKIKDAQQADQELKKLERYERHLQLVESLKVASEALETLQHEKPGIDNQIEGSEHMLDSLKKNLATQNDRLVKLINQVGFLSLESREASEPILDADIATLSGLVTRIEELRVATISAKREFENSRDLAMENRNTLTGLLNSVNPDDFPIPTEDAFERLLQTVRILDENRVLQAKRLGIERLQNKYTLKVEQERSETKFISAEEKEDYRKRILGTETTKQFETHSIIPQAITLAVLMVATATIPILVMRVAVGILAAGVAIYFCWQLSRIPMLSREQETSDETRRQVALEVLCDITKKEARLATLNEYLESLNDLTPIETPVSLELQSEAEALGLSVANGAHLQAWYEKLRAYLSAREQAKVTESKFVRLKQETADVEKEFAENLSRHGFEVRGDHPRDALNAFQNWIKTSRDISEIRDSIVRQENELYTFLNVNGIPRSENLEERILEFERRTIPASVYRQTLRERSEAESELGRLDPREVLEMEGKFDELSDGGSAADQIERLREHLASELEMLHDLTNKRAKIQAEIDLANRERQYESALKDHAKACRVLEDAWRKSRIREAHVLLIDHIQKRLQTVDLPDVLNASNAWLARFTNNRWMTQLAPKSKSKGVFDGFGFLDKETGQTKSWEELSTGSKVHVMISIRLGLIEENERATNGGLLKFPIVVDEAMAVSDEQSSRALAKTLIEISEERQVIFFTNQLDDVELMKDLVPGLKERSL